MAGVAATPFVGRREELATLLAALDADGASVVRVSGEAGVGKSRLVAEAIARSERTTAVGISSPGSLGRPFDLLLSAVEPSVRGWTAVPAALTAVRGALVQLLRSVAPALDDDAPSDPESPAELISAGIALIRHLDVDVLVLEDLQWADTESLLVVERLVAGPEHPVIVITYRTEDLDGRGSAAEIIDAMGSRRTGQHIHVEPLGTDEIEELLTRQFGRPASATVVKRLRVRTGGNPFFLEEVLTSTDDWDQPRTVLDDMPVSLTETIHQKLNVLTPDERDALTTAAVLGSPFEFDLLATALDVDESELIHRLRTLIERRLIVEPEVDTFRFRHELVRESIMSSLLGRERRRLHERAWTATTQHRPDEYAELARHAAGSGRLDDLARVAPDGIRRYTARGSTRQALVLAEMALGQWPDDTELRELAAQAAWLTGEADKAQDHARRWHDLSLRRDDTVPIDALALLARVAYEREDFATEAEIVAEMEDLLVCASEPALRARLLAWLAQHHMLLDNFDIALERAERAIELATELGLDDLVRQVTVEQATARSWELDHREESIAILERVAKEAESVGEFVTAARALHNLSLHQAPEMADLTLDEMARVADRGGFDLASAVLVPIRKVRVAMARADQHDAQEWLDRSRAFGRQPVAARHLTLDEVVLRLEAGAPIDPDMLDRLPTDTPPAWSVRLRCAARDRDLSTVHRLLDNPAVGPRSLGALAAALSDLATAEVSTDRIAAARDRMLDAHPEQAAQGVAEALIAERVDDPAAADLLAVAGNASTDLARSAIKAEALGRVVDAELRLAQARLARRAGRMDDARDHACAAADLLHRWPGPRRDEALALSAEPTCTKDLDLTGREIDVARLVARGMTNGQIAEELFISRKTVSTHVSHILSKLAMSSRTEIATWAVRTGLTSGDM